MYEWALVEQISTDELHKDRSDTFGKRLMKFAGSESVHSWWLIHFSFSGNPPRIVSDDIQNGADWRPIQNIANDL